MPAAASSSGHLRSVQNGLCSTQILIGTSIHHHLVVAYYHPCTSLTMTIGHRPLQFGVTKNHFTYFSDGTGGQFYFGIATDHRPAAGPPIHTGRFRLEGYRIATG